HDRRDRRRIIGKQFPYCKAKNVAVNDGHGRQREAGGGVVDVAVELRTALEDAGDGRLAEGQRAARGDFGIRLRRFGEAPLEDGRDRVIAGVGLIEAFEHEEACPPHDAVGHAITMPPSTWMHCPVMYAPPGPARKATRGATSS